MAEAVAGVRGNGLKLIADSDEAELGTRGSGRGRPPGGEPPGLEVGDGQSPVWTVNGARLDFTAAGRS
jgi:hypothetical protein